MAETASAMGERTAFLAIKIKKDPLFLLLYLLPDSWLLPGDLFLLLNIIHKGVQRIFAPSAFSN